MRQREPFSLTALIPLSPSYHDSRTVTPAAPSEGTKPGVAAAANQSLAKIHVFLIHGIYFSTSMIGA